MNLAGYLKRIGFSGNPDVSLATLKTIHRLHLTAIPYETLDVQLNRTIGFEIRSIYAKLVDARRGGWCYEMNGLLGWALEQIGFSVIRVAGAVMRESLGERAHGNHLALVVQLDQLYLADVGLGDGLLEPIPILAGEYKQEFLHFSLQEVGVGWWRFRNHPRGGAPSFDFKLEAADRTLLAERSHWLQTSPESMFVQNSICVRWTQNSYIAMRGRVFKIIAAEDSASRTTVDNLHEYREALNTLFGIIVHDDETLWEIVCALHTVFKQRQSAATSATAVA